MLSEKELQILSMLRENSRFSLAHISETTNIPKSTVFDIIKKHERSTITKYTSLLNFTKLGFFVRANFALTTNNEELLKFLKQCMNINSIQKTNKGYYIDTFFKSMKGFYEFSERLDSFNLKEKKEIHIIHSIKNEEFKIKKK